MVDAICRAAQDGWNGYSPSDGEEQLRIAAAEKEKRVNGINVDPDRMIVTSGVSEAIQFLCGALVGNGSELLVPGPSYPPYISVYNEKTLKEIVAIAGEHGLPLISDEIYDQLTYDEPQTPMVRIAGDVPVIGFNGVSKVYLAPGWRVGYAYFNDSNGELDPLYDAMIRQARIRICLNTNAQIAAATALAGDGSHLKETMSRLRVRRDLIHKRLNEIDSISTRLPEAAFYIMPKIELRDRWKDDSEFVKDVLAETGVVFVPGRGFGEEYGAGHFRSVFLPPPEMIEEAMNRLEGFMATH